MEPVITANIENCVLPSQKRNNSELFNSLIRDVNHIVQPCLFEILFMQNNYNIKYVLWKKKLQLNFIFKHN